MNKTTRFLTLFIVVVLISVIFVPVAGAAHVNFRGIWHSTDIDGSYQILKIQGGPSGNYHVNYIDYGATVCGDVDPVTGYIPFAATARGFLSETDDTISGDLTVTCRTRPPTNIGSYNFSFSYDSSTDTLVDGFGAVWTR